MDYKGRALTIAGSDSGGGAGIQADLKTFYAFGVYGMSVVTSVTSQNTMKISSIHDIPVNIVADQIDMVLEDIGADAVKTGMLSNKEIIEVVANRVERYGIDKLVVDPVIVAKSGDRLLREDAENTLIERLLPLTLVITPNVFEAEIFNGMRIKGLKDIRESARIIHQMGAKFVLLKGGHLTGEKSIDVSRGRRRLQPASRYLTREKSIDVLFDGRDYSYYESERIDTKNTHGTGCTFSAAITAGLAKGLDVYNAIRIAKDYIERAIRDAPGNIGKGHGPLYHNIEPVLSYDTDLS